MAVRESDMSSSGEGKSSKIKKKPSKKAFLLAHDLKLARILAGNDKTRRERALKNLRKWFQSRTETMPLTKDDFLRIWKGLFYSMWMSDKPLIQEECAENISNLAHALPPQTALLFFQSGLEVLNNEWFGIDQLRLDKFLMFVRRLLRQILFVLKNSEWDQKLCEEFSKIVTDFLAPEGDSKPCLGLLMHFSEIFLEEVAKTSNGELKPNLLLVFVEPFIKKMAFSNDSRLVSHFRTHVFVYLIRQSELGLKFDEKFRAWRSMGFPGGRIDAIEEVQVEGDEDGEDGGEDGEVGSDGSEGSSDEKVLDPRAGRVDVKLPQIGFHAKSIARALRKYKFEKGTNVKSRDVLNKLAEQFTKLSKGVYPLGIKKINKGDSSEIDTNVRKAVNRLVKFDRKIKENGSAAIERKRKKKTRSKANDNQNPVAKKVKTSEITDDSLEAFIDESEGEIQKKRRKTNLKTDQPIESIFRRNSGTWFVTCTSQKSTDQLTESPTLGTVIEDQLKVTSPKISKKTRNTELFPKSDWDNSALNSRQKVFKPRKSFDDVISDTLSNFTTARTNVKRLSLDSQLLGESNVGGFSSSPAKKVKINMKLNKSQDVNEHITQILSSPQIPYDANKKPVKPLLKTPAKESPINPFYKRPKFLVGK